MKKPLLDNFGERHLTQGEKDQRAQLSRAARPRIAATIVLTHGPRDNPRILMGKRSARHDFMPSVYVFPGGRVDRADSYAAYTGKLTSRNAHILEAAFTPRKARAVVLAAIRETYEETSLFLAQAADVQKNVNHPSWDAFRAAGLKADLTNIDVFGRAITPPHRHKRFDAWFFHKDMGEAPLPVIKDSAELLDVGWFTFEQIKELDLQRATKMMLNVLQDYLKYDRPPRDIFYSYARNGKYLSETFPNALP